MDKIEVAKKLKALAERGDGGEATNAEALLNRLMEKYGISEAELSEDEVKRYELTFHGKEEKTILIQTAYKVTDGKGRVYGLRYTYSGRPCKTTLAVECTPAQKIEIEFLFNFYKRLYEREREIFLRAFIQKHELFDNQPPEGEIKPIDPEEIKKMLKLMAGMSDENPLRQITDGSEEARE